jgi:tetratricopeptide (TPR) repeat protein
MIRYSLLIIKVLFVILFSLTIKAEKTEQPAVLETEKPVQESAKVEDAQPVIKDEEPQVQEAPVIKSEDAQPVIQDTAPQVEEEPNISEIKAVQEEVEKIVEPERVLSPEEKAMQDIEPSFVPKDEKVLEIFLLNKVVEDNEISIKKQKEEKIAIRNRLIKNYQQNLELYTKRSLIDKEKIYDKALQDSISAYEKAIKHNPNNKVFTQDALYNYGWMSFDVDEKEYFRKLAIYSEAKEKGIDTVEYPEENFSRTINAYKTLIKNHPKFRHIDNVYYLYALSLWYEGDFYKAVKYFQQLIAKYPKSKFVEEVWFRLGEYFYDMDEYDNAINAYNKVAKNKKSPLYDKAIYKIAWTYFQKDNYDLAIENFVKLLRLFYAKNSQITDSSMKEEVIRYIVKSFSEKQNLNTQKSLSKNKEEQKELAEQEGALLSKSIYDYFVRLKKPAFTRDIMLEVAKQLIDESKLIGAVNAFELAIKLSPKNPDNPRIDSQIVDIFQEAGELEKARKKNIDIIKRYGQRSRWVKSQKPSSDGAKFARDAVRDAMLSLAVYYHKTGKELMSEGKEENKEAAKLNFKKAADLYVRYIKEYPEKEDTYKAIFYFAESAYELRRFKNCSRCL